MKKYLTSKFDFIYSLRYLVSLCLRQFCLGYSSANIFPKLSAICFVIDIISTPFLYQKEKCLSSSFKIHIKWLWNNPVLKHFHPCPSQNYIHASWELKTISICYLLCNRSFWEYTFEHYRKFKRYQLCTDMQIASKCLL